jgi:transposase
VDVVGRKVSKERLLADIYATARTSIGLPLPIDAPAIRMFRMVIAEARSLIRQRNEIEDMADAMLRDSADYKALRKVPGIGPVIALTILAEGGDLRRFRHHRQFLKFCGLDLSTQQSGQHRGQTRLSKFGNARLRRTLWIAGQVAIRHRENGFRHKFERQRSGQSGSQTQGAHRYYRQDGSRRTRDHQKRFRLPALRRRAGTRWKNLFLRSREGAQGVTL